ncbi:MAG: hypothetical protein IT566_04560 [Rhodospirillaceae bacterium]|nr:hypothetical protein [Rhodospirillaceae bacterium]
MAALERHLPTGQDHPLSGCFLTVADPRLDPNLFWQPSPRAGHRYALCRARYGLFAQQSVQQSGEVVTGRRAPPAPLAATSARVCAQAPLQHMQHDCSMTRSSHKLLLPHANSRIAACSMQHGQH